MGTKTSALAALTALADGDLVVVVDVSDTSMAPTGTNKKITAANFIDFIGSPPLEVRNASSFNLQAGGAVHYTVPADTLLAQFDATTGSLMLGQNLTKGAFTSTNQKSVADFCFDQTKLRLLTRNITLSEISDPADLDLRRYGPEQGYPYAVVDNGNGDFNDLTGIGAGNIIGQVRGTASRVPYGGDQDTPGGAAVESGALLAFQTAEMPRQITPNNQMAVGTRIYFAIVPNGSQNKVERWQINQTGHVLHGAKAILAGDGTALLQIRSHEGTDNVQTLTMQGSPTGGDFTLDYYKFPTSIAEYPAKVTTAAIARTASAATLQSALVTAIQGLSGDIPGSTVAFSSVTSADVGVSGGPINTTPVVVTFTGLLGLHRHVKLESTSSLTGGTNPRVTTAETTEGFDHEKANRLLNLRGVTGQTVDYFRVQDGAAVDVLRLDKDGILIVPGQITVSGVFRHTGSTFAVFNQSPTTQPAAYTQTYSTVTRTHAARTAAALNDNSGGTPSGTLSVITMPADSPASADALRDDLVTNSLAAIKNAIASLADQVNKLRADQINTAGVVNSLVDDHQVTGLAAT